jgi:hypothetical protein
MTKKQREEIEMAYKCTYYKYNLLDDPKLKEEYSQMLNGIMTVMNILNFKDDDYTNLKNEVLKDYKPELYNKYLQINNIIDKAIYKHYVFKYELRNLNT